MSRQRGSAAKFDRGLMRLRLNLIRRGSLWAVTLVAVLWAGYAAATTGDPVRRGPEWTPTADHTKFRVLEGPFSSGPEVTRACLRCHTEAAKQLQATTHWTWSFDNPITGQTLGKRNIINNFCVSIETNWPRCTSCHIGFGWSDNSFDHRSEDSVDCLVCHDNTGTYVKDPLGAGHPPYRDTEFPPGSGNIIQAPDLIDVARYIGMPTRRNCGACHFNGGEADGAKHGDLDSSLIKPDRSLDVHMDAAGLNFVCSTCHTTQGHAVTGSRYMTKAVDTVGIDVPGHTDRTRTSCESCHGPTPHATRHKLDDHTDKVACQTCHIPEIARGSRKTLTWWDWSAAGQRDTDGQPFTRTDDDGYVIYDSHRGEFRWQGNLVPEYHWFDGRIRYTLIGEAIDESKIVPINTFGGGYDEPRSRIWPFKVMRGRQPYDKVHKTLLLPHTVGDDYASYFRNMDWTSAIEVAMAHAGLPFSGEIGFVETAYFWPSTHMVAPKEDALACNDCHSRNGRLAGVPGFYMPGRDSFEGLQWTGWTLVILTLVVSVAHIAARIGAARQRS